MNLMGMLETWMAVLTRPGEDVYEEIKPQANLTTALIWVVIAAVIAGLLAGAGAAVSSLFNMGNMAAFEEILNDPSIDPATREMLGTFLAPAAAGGGILASAFIAICATIIFAPLAFLIGSGIYFVIARVFGGEGSFELQSFYLAAITAPISIISAALNVIPLLGACLAIFVSIYQLVLTYFAMKVAHNVSGGRALGIILTPIAIYILCVCSVALIFFALFASIAESSGGF